MNKFSINKFFYQLKEIPFKFYFIIFVFLYYISSFYYLVGALNGIIITIILIIVTLLSFYFLLIIYTKAMQERDRIKAKKMGITYEEYRLMELDSFVTGFSYKPIKNKHVSEEIENFGDNKSKKKNRKKHDFSN